MKNNFITKIIGATLAFAMMIGGAVGINAAKEAKEVNAASGATSSKITIDCSNNLDGWQTSAQTSEHTIVVGGFTFGYKSCYYSSSNSNYYVMMKSSAGVIYNKTAIPNISSISFTYSSGTSEKAKVYVNQGASVISTRQTSGYTDSLDVVKSGTKTTTGTYSNAKKYLAFSVSNSNNIQVTKIEINYTAASNFGTLHHVKVGTPASKLTYVVGETFSSSGLVLTGYDAEDEASANTQTYSSGYTTNYDGHVFTAQDIGEQTVTVTYSGKTVTYIINVEIAPDFVHSYASNPMFNRTSANTSATSTFTPTSGPEYITLGGYKWSSGEALSLANSANMYFGNNDYYKLNDVNKNINKIVINTNADVSAVVQMTEGPIALSDDTTVVPTLSNDNKTLTYVFSGNYPFFKFKTTTSGTYVNMTSVKVYLGTDAVEIEVASVSATIDSGTYYADDPLDASNFNLTVTWTGGKPATHPTEGFTWTVNGIANGVLNVGNNSVVVTYSGVESEPFNVVGSAYDAYRYLNNTESIMSINATETAVPTSESDNSNIVFENAGYDNAEDVTNVEIGRVMLECSAGTGTNAPKYYDTGKGLRAYPGNTLTFTCLTNISEISFTFSSNSYSSGLAVMDDNGTYENGVWNGASNSVTIAFTADSGSVRIQRIDVTYVRGELSVSGVALRFGASIPVSDWNIINEKDNWEITDYGVMLYKTKAQYAETAPTVQDRYAANHSYVATFNKGSGVAPTAEDGKYTFTARIDYTDETEYSKYIIAQAFIVVNGTDYYFLGEEMRESVRSLAGKANVETNLSSDALTYLTTAGN